MTPMEVIRYANADGVGLALSATGTIKVAGDDAAVDRWIDVIREHKVGIVDLLKAGADVPDPAPVRTWRVQFQDRDSINVTVIPYASREEVASKYPSASSIEPWEPVVDLPASPMTDHETNSVRSWLAYIHESDPTTIAEVIRRCNESAGARAYFVKRGDDALVAVAGVVP